MLGHQQFAFTAQVSSQFRIKDETPENVPVARFAVHRIFVDYQIVVIFRFAWGPILHARHHHIKVQALVRRFFIAQPLTQVPRTNTGQLARARYFRRENEVVTIMIDGEWLHRGAHGGKCAKARGKNRKG